MPGDPSTRDRLYIGVYRSPHLGLVVDAAVFTDPTEVNEMGQQEASVFTRVAS